MALGKLQLITIAVLGFVSTATMADDGGSKIQHLVDPVTSIESWILHDQGVEVELIQISPDQARGFFLARVRNPRSIEDHRPVRRAQCPNR